jgi:hypothetical protein
MLASVDALISLIQMRNRAYLSTIAGLLFARDAGAIGRELLGVAFVVG